MKAVDQDLQLPEKCRIFIVEDDRIVAEDLREILEKRGYEIVGTASNGRESIEGIKKTEPDLLLMDVRIDGELNGIEVAIVAGSLFERPIPIIFITGLLEKEYTYLNVLTDYVYINKPIQEHLLLEAVARCLKKYGCKPK
jgi:CheY-like chemotaxis protein